MNKFALKSIILTFLLSFSLIILAQDFSNYKSTKSAGDLPDDFTNASTAKIENFLDGLDDELESLKNERSSNRKGSKRRKSSSKRKSTSKAKSSSAKAKERAKEKRATEKAERAEEKTEEKEEKERGKEEKEQLDEDIASEKIELEETKAEDSDAFFQTSFLINNLMLSGKVVFGGKVGNYINNIANTLLANDTETREAMRFYVIKSAAVNAFTSNDGIGFITTGLLARLNTESQLAYVISYLIGHYKSENKIEPFIEKREIEGSLISDFTLMDLEKNFIEKNNFTTSAELKADQAGFNLFNKSNYSRSELLEILDSYKKSDKPWADIEYDIKFLSSNDLYFVDNSIYTAKKITNKSYASEKTALTNSFFNDSIYYNRKKLLDKRRDYIDSLEYNNDNEEVGEQFIVSEQIFKAIKREARYDLSEIYFYKGAYEKCIYNNFLLEKTYEKGNYINKLNAFCLNRLSKLKNYQNFRTLNLDSCGKNVQSVYEVIHALTAEELTLLAATYTFEIWDINQTDKSLTALINDVMFENTLYFKDLKYFKSLRELQGDQDRKNEEERLKALVAVLDAKDAEAKAAKEKLLKIAIAEKRLEARKKENLEKIAKLKKDTERKIYLAELETKNEILKLKDNGATPQEIKIAEVKRNAKLKRLKDSLTEDVEYIESDIENDKIVVIESRKVVEEPEFEFPKNLLSNFDYAFTSVKDKYFFVKSYDKALQIRANFNKQEERFGRKKDQNKIGATQDLKFRNGKNLCNPEVLFVNSDYLYFDYTGKNPKKQYKISEKSRGRYKSILIENARDIGMKATFLDIEEFTSSDVEMYNEFIIIKNIMNERQQMSLSAFLLNYNENLRNLPMVSYNYEAVKGISEKYNTSKICFTGGLSLRLEKEKITIKNIWDRLANPLTFVLPDNRSLLFVTLMDLENNNIEFEKLIQYKRRDANRYLHSHAYDFLYQMHDCDKNEVIVEVLDKDKQRKRNSKGRKRKRR